MTHLIYAPLALLFASAYPMPIGHQDGQEDAAQSEAEIIDIQRDRARRMTIPVRIGDNGPFSFLIDTGSERTAVSSRVAGELQLEFAETALLVSVAGSKVVETVYLPDLTLGKQNYGEVVAPILEAQDIGADGILGLDGLQNQRVMFDFSANTIAVEDVGGREAGSGYEIVVTARRRSGQLIFTDARIAGVRVNVVIDTGAQNNIGNRALQRRLLGRIGRGVAPIQTELLSVTGQKISADAAFARKFEMGRLRFDQIGIAFADAPTFAELGLEERPTLLLGMDTLRHFDRVAIDFKNRKVFFDIPDDPI
ncbi:MAG: retroviral-like aspartic protease family protein [Blastomonas sp.]